MSAGGHTQMTFGVPSTIGPLRTGRRALGVGGLGSFRAPDADDRRSGRAGLRVRQLIVAPCRDARVSLCTKVYDPGCSGTAETVLANEGEIVRKSPAEFGQFIAADTAKWGKVVVKRPASSRSDGVDCGIVYPKAAAVLNLHVTN